MSENNCDDENMKVKKIKISEADNQNLSINDLPEECLLEIFSWFDPSELVQVDEVCQRWESLCEQFWKVMRNIIYSSGYWTVDQLVWYKIDNETDVNQLKKLLERCGKYITHFEISNFSSTNPSHITKNLLRIVPQLCKNLTSMKIISKDLLSVVIQTIAKNLENLIELEIRCLGEGLESDFCKILENNKNLKILKMSSDPVGQSKFGSTCKFLQYLSPGVEKIYMDQRYNRYSSCFKTAFRKFKRLQLFKCDGTFDYAMMQALTWNRSLIKLSLSLAKFKSPMRSINTLGNLVNLKKLNISFVHQLKDDNLIHITNNCKQLKALNIEFCEYITDKGIVSIANLPQLEFLNMGNIDCVTDNSIGNLSDSLERLWCVGCRFIKNDGVIKLIRKSSKLRYIDLMDTSVTVALHQIVEEVNRTRSNCDQIEILTGETDPQSGESPPGALILDSDDDEDDYWN
ncbi:hypothetical protein PV326_001107 [Microctonus aethiopoides]|nr:hypothetical protein PV326_001107 [Microctonus aethiopoides]